MSQNDTIFIKALRVSAHIGVPDEERATAQELLIHASFSPISSQKWETDDISQTIDYHAVSLRLEEEVASKPRKLIETLAEDLARVVLDEFAVSEVTIQIEKFILPNTQCVGVRITRQKPQA